MMAKGCFSYSLCIACNYYQGIDGGHCNKYGKYLAGIANDCATATVKVEGSSTFLALPARRQEDFLWKQTLQADASNVQHEETKHGGAYEYTTLHRVSLKHL